MRPHSGSPLSFGDDDDAEVSWLGQPEKREGGRVSALQLVPHPPQGVSFGRISVDG